MATIQEQLRFRAKVRGESDLRAGRKRPEYGPEAELEWKAADVIDALQKTNAELAKGLSDIVALVPNPTLPLTHAIRDIATAVLSRARGGR